MGIPVLPAWYTAMSELRDLCLDEFFDHEVTSDLMNSLSPESVLLSSDLFLEKTRLFLSSDFFEYLFQLFKSHPAWGMGAMAWPPGADFCMQCGTVPPLAAGIIIPRQMLLAECQPERVSIFQVRAHRFLFKEADLSGAIRKSMCSQQAKKWIGKPSPCFTPALFSAPELGAYRILDDCNHTPSARGLPTQHLASFVLFC